MSESFLVGMVVALVPDKQQQLQADARICTVKYIMAFEV